MLTAPKWLKTWTSKNAPSVGPDMTPGKMFEKGAWPGSRDPANFWPLNANTSKMAKDMDFKFCTHAPRVIPDMTSVKNVEIGCGWGHVTP